MVDSPSQLPVVVLNSSMPFSSSDGFHYPQQVMGTFIPVKTRVFPLGLVFEIQADWLPCNRQVTMRLYLVNDPPGRNPTPRSDRINPEFYIRFGPRIIIDTVMGARGPWCAQTGRQPTRQRCRQFRIEPPSQNAKHPNQSGHHLRTPSSFQIPRVCIRAQLKHLSP